MMKGQHISWKYKKQSAAILQNVSFEIKTGRITTFMGPSGAGKTTLLKCLANIHAEYEGSIMWNEQDLKTLNPLQRASLIGFVLQQFHLFPHLTALQNCTYALIHTLKIKQKEAEKQALEILDSLGMASFAQSFPSQLSGGQQQRIAIARALSLRPNVLLLDEPTSALDPESKKDLENLLLNLNARGMTIALSSHDMPFIRNIMDIVYFMEKGMVVEAWDRQLEILHSKEKIKNFLTH